MSSQAIGSGRPRALAIAAVLALGAAAAVAAALLWPYAAGGMLSVQVREAAAADADGRSVDWAALREINPDVAAWVTVPGTAIDYPVVQARPEDPEHWLSHAFDGSPNRVGSVYLDAESQGDGVSALTPYVYGHSLLDGSMFSDFARFADPSYASEHDRIEVSAPEGDMELRVIGVAVVPGDSGRRTGVSGQAALASFYADALSRCGILLDPPSGVDRLWTFVTCAYSTGNYRVLVLACSNDAGRSR